VKKKPQRLKGRARELASKFIAEEVGTGKYPRVQAVAIGISRARVAAGEKPRKSRIAGIMERYR
jgi:hypothetical protein